jgi:hypothetical protein
MDSKSYHKRDPSWTFQAANRHGSGGREALLDQRELTDHYFVFVIVNPD